MPLKTTVKILISGQIILAAAAVPMNPSSAANSNVYSTQLACAVDTLHANAYNCSGQVDLKYILVPVQATGITCQVSADTWQYGYISGSQFITNGSSAVTYEDLYPAYRSNAPMFIVHQQLFIARGRSFSIHLFVSAPLPPAGNCSFVAEPL